MLTVASHPTPALLYYDYLITLPDEVQHFWFKRPTAVTVFFFLNRYLNLIGNVPLILQGLVQWSDEVRYDQFYRIGTVTNFSFILGVCFGASFRRYNMTAEDFADALAFRPIIKSLWL